MNIDNNSDITMSNFVCVPTLYNLEHVWLVALEADGSDPILLAVNSVFAPFWHSAILIEILGKLTRVLKLEFFLNRRIYKRIRKGSLRVPLLAMEDST